MRVRRIALRITSAAVIVVIALAVIAFRGDHGGPSSASAHLGGYLATTADHVVFVQWTRTKDTISGSASFATMIDQTRVDQTNSPFTGVVSGKSVSLSFQLGPTWNGVFQGKELLLSGPSNGGALTT